MHFMKTISFMYIMVLLLFSAYGVMIVTIEFMIQKQMRK